ncbi:Uncharacterized protein PBTT_09166 [Plasmodiophora brassicae]
MSNFAAWFRMRNGNCRSASRTLLDDQVASLCDDGSWTVRSRPALLSMGVPVKTLVTLVACVQKQTHGVLGGLIC